MNQSAGRFFSALSRGMLMAFAAVVPLIAFPWTVDPLDINKQTFAIVVIVIAVVAWLGGMLVRREADMRATWLFAPLGGLLVAGIISATTSLAPYTSFVGQGAQEYTSVLSLVVFLAFFVVGVHVLQSRRAQRQLWSGVIVSATIVAIMGSLAWFGIASSSIPMNLIGTPNALAIFLLAVSLLGAGLWLTSAGEADDVLPRGVFGAFLRGCIVVLSLLTLFMLVAIDYSALWVVALVGVLVLFTFALARAKEFPHPGRFVLPMIFFVVSLMFMFLPSVVTSPFPSEIAPTPSMSWSVVSRGLEDTSTLFGSGPGTFVLDYTKYQPASLNATAFWDTRFDRGASHVLTFLGTYGALGALAFGVFVLALGILALSRLIFERNHEEWRLTFAPFAAWLMLVVAMTVYAQNFTLAALFWIVSTVLAAHVTSTVRNFAFSRSPQAGLLAAFCFVLAAVGMLTTMFVTISRYRAEIAFAAAVVVDQQGGDINDVILHLDQAASVNRWSDIAYRNLGNALLHKTADVVVDPNVDPDLVKSLIAAAVNAAVRATDLGPNNVANWELRGDVYREVSPLVSDAPAFAVASYQTAIALSPTNPRYEVSLARAYLAQADVLQPLIDGDDKELASQAQAQADAAITQAETALNTAIALKSDYASARYYLAFVQEREGKLADAVRSMELVRATNASDVGVSMQLALLYLRQGKNALAKAELERAIALVPNYANAHWYLASILEDEGDIDGALAALNVVLSLNPDNETVAKRIAALEAGKVAATLPEPLEGTVDEATPSTETTP